MNDRRMHGPMERGGRPPAPRVLLGLQVTAVVILVGWALHATASVSSLLAAAFFVAVMLAPMDAAIAERAGGRRWVGHLASLLVMIMMLLTFALGLLFAAQRVASEFPALSQLPTEQIPGVEAQGDGAQEAQAPSGASPPEDRDFGGLLGQIELSAGELFSRLGNAAGDAAATGLQFATAALGGIVLVIFLALMMLVDAPSWRGRIGRVMGGERCDATLEAISVMGRMVRRFVLVRAGVGLLTALLYMGYLWLFGVELILVWGILTLLLSFIPNLGSILSGILPTIYVFLTKDFGTALAVGAGLTAIEQVIGNYVDPRLQGRQVSISPVVILSALLVFAWIWGVPGTLLSTPMLIAATVVFARTEALRPTALLLSDCDDHEALDRMVRE